jgi:Orthopoxvirus protein of unknown function (DUF830).
MKPLLVFAILLWPVTAYAVPPLLNGDLVLTRNDAETGNTSPGYWNHVAIVAVSEGVTYIIEAQGGHGVIAVDERKFFERYPKYRIFRYADRDAGYRAAVAAWERIGTPYLLTASIRARIRPDGDGDNCVSLVRRAYLKATGHDFGWRQPDHLIGILRRQGFVPIHQQE